jgi:hypothetical protein
VPSAGSSAPRAAAIGPEMKRPSESTTIQRVGAVLAVSVAMAALSALQPLLPILEGHVPLWAYLLTVSAVAGGLAGLGIYQRTITREPIDW